MVLPFLSKESDLSEKPEKPEESDLSDLSELSDEDQSMLLRLYFLEPNPIFSACSMV